MSQSQQTPQIQFIYFVLDVLRITGRHLSMTILQHFLHLRRIILLRLTQVTGFGNIVLHIADSTANLPHNATCLHDRCIALLLESLGRCHFFQRHIQRHLGCKHLILFQLFRLQAILIARNPVRNTSTCRILTRHQANVRGRTDGHSCISVSEYHAFRRQPVDVGSLVETTPVITNIGPTIIADHNKSHIRFTVVAGSVEHICRQSNATGKGLKTFIQDIHIRSV